MVQLNPSEFLQDGFSMELARSIAREDYNTAYKLLTKLSPKTFAKLHKEILEITDTPLLCMVLLSNHNTREIQEDTPCFKTTPIQLKIIKKALELGANPNEFVSFYTPLGKMWHNPMITATLTNSVEALKLYKEAGGNLDFTHQEAGTLLFQIVASGFHKHLPALAYLIESKVQLDKTVNGCNILQAAANAKTPTAFDMLVLGGANPNTTNKAGYPVAHIIIRNTCFSDEDVITSLELLQKRGAHLDACDPSGRTLMDTANFVHQNCKSLRLGVIAYINHLQRKQADKDTKNIPIQPKGRDSRD